VPISARGAVPGGVHADSTRLIDATLKPARMVMELDRAEHLPGEHNRQNAAAAWAASRALDVPAPAVAAGILSYPGLAHRQELVATIAGARFINDSKATNADAAAKALACYDTIYWIAGGRAKEGGIAGLEAYYPRIRHAFLIGEAAEAFAATLDGHVGWTRSGTLGAALDAAKAMAAAEGLQGAVVLLSPAAASFDQYANFEERGSHFRHLVEGGSPS
jgi:UDP-N-acetylmuramoylalanine--D-glutamate ligase